MKSRLELSEILRDILGSENVYFQPPPTKKMNYPAIVYHLSDIDTTYANNKMYIGTKNYSITVIDKNPDSIIPDKILELPLTSFSTFFMSDGLNHFVFSTYF